MNSALPTTTEIYTVALELNQESWVYPSFSASHQDALERACAEHYRVWGSWPLGARCLVQGPCREAECLDHGKVLTIEGVLNSEGLRVTNYQHR
jgi:hypothetical protein